MLNEANIFLTVACIVILSLLFGCAYYNTLFNAKKNYEEGVREISKNPDRTQVPSRAKTYFETTIEKCWKLIELYSDQSKWADDALLYICKSEYYLQEYTQAKLHLEQFLKKYPESKLFAEANLWYGKVLLRLDQLKKGDEHLRYAINNSDDSKIHSEAYFELGSYQFENKNYENAIDYYQQALKKDPDDQYRALLQFNLGEAFYIQENHESAIEHFKKVEDHDPSLEVEFRTKIHMADSYSALGNFKEAHKILRKMLTAPRFKDFVPTIKTEIGENYETQQQYIYAIDIYKETILERQNSEGTAQAAFNLAQIYENAYKNVDSAVVYYGEVGRLYNRFDSLEIAKDKEIFLRELKDIRDEIKQDRRLVFKLENDPYFRDSLYNAQYEDSIQKLLDTTQVDSPAAGESFDEPIPGFQDTLWNADADSIEEGSDSNVQQQEDTTEVFGQEDDIFSERPFPPREKNREEGEREPSPQEAPKEEVERRKLPRIKKDLMSNRYQLAEYYLLKVENYDSAEYYFKNFLSQHEDTLLTPKALYSLRFIYTRPEHRDSAAVDSLENIILNQYPESIFSQEILKQRGVLIEEKEADSLEKQARQLFLEAESLYFAQNIDSALRKYEKVADMDTVSEWGAKAMYAKAWIYEKELNDKQLALNTYEKIIAEYPKSPDYLSMAKKKTTPPTETPETPPASVEGMEDTTATEIDTVETKDEIREEITPESGPQASSQNIEREKILWRMRRYRR